MAIEKVELKVIEPLEKEFIDNSYWNVTKPDPEEDDIDYDALYDELEAWANYPMNIVINAEDHLL